MKFFHRYETNGGLVLQDRECIIAAGRYILFHYPRTGEFSQIDEKINTYPGVVEMTMNEYIGRMGFFKGWWLTIKNFLGISHCRPPSYEPEERAETYEDFFDGTNTYEGDIRPPVIVGGIGYEKDEKK